MTLQPFIANGSFLHETFFSIGRLQCKYPIEQNSFLLNVGMILS